MTPPGESLGRLARAVGADLVGDGSVHVTDVTHDSRQVGPGTLFVAVTGFRLDGHEFAAAAVDAGAPAIAVERRLPVDVPQLICTDTRAALGPLAAAVHGRPADDLDIVGITGTNGKTTVAYLVESLLRQAGHSVGLIGTIQTRIDGQAIPTLRTTPEASDLQRILAAMRDRGADTVSMEVSSHALRLQRVEAVRFRVAAFTNLSQDHLDFHGSMEEYFEVKAGLFEPARAEQAVIWVDDPHGARLAADARIPVTTVSAEGEGDLSAVVDAVDLEGTDMTVTFPDGTVRTARLPLPGRFNVANGLIAMACALRLGLDPETVTAGLAEAEAAPGRFERVSTPDDQVTVIVDYAHTPAGIEHVVRAARELATGAVVAVVGAGGDRDRGKRPAMGAAAATADRVVVTNDNPRSEDPAAIIDSVMSGIPEQGRAVRIPDRAEAIDQAIRAASPGDVVLVLGKGHERGQEVADRILPFDDRIVCRRILRDLREGAS
jgi:UDP-N-acetylmuramoyl-L-alanyl-D-glutamate--2,6-diaminopimelate ligase